MGSTNRRFQFQKCCQDFIGAHDETISIAVCVNNPDRSPLENFRLNLVALITASQHVQNPPFSDLLLPDDSAT